MRDAMETLLASHSGRSAAEVRKEMERERYLTADAAKEYGLIDAVVTGRDERKATSMIRLAWARLCARR